MRSVRYWSAATVLVTGLLVGFFLIAYAVEASGWPFGRVWGAFLFLLGAVLVVLGWKYPRVLWKVGAGQSPSDSEPLSQAGRKQALLGVGVLVGGAAYALTANLDILIGALVVAAMLQWVWPWRPPRGEDRERPGPPAA